MSQHERIPGEGLLAEAGHPAADPSRHPEVAVIGERQPRIGVLALQGDVLEHLRMLRAAGARAVAVKRAAELDGLDGILIPGGESTTIGKLAVLYGLMDPLRERIDGGLPAFGTCAGAILLGREALHDDGRHAEQPLLGCMDIVLRRNAFGRQVASFEADVDVDGVAGGPMHAVFIRAPWIENAGDQVVALASVPTPLGVRVVVARQGHLLASAFHPELAGDGRLHELFVAFVRERQTGSAASREMSEG